MRALPSLLLLLPLAACVTAAPVAPPPPPPVAPPPPFTDADAFVLEAAWPLVEARLAAQAGALLAAIDGAAPEPVPPAPDALLTPALCLAAQRGARAGPPDERRAMQALAAFLVSERIAATAAAHPPPPRLPTGDRAIALDQLGPALARLPDAPARVALAAQAAALATADAPARLAAAAVADGLAHECSFPDRLAAARAARGIDAATEAAAARDFLSATDAAARAALSDAGRRELGAELSALRPADLPRLFAGPGFQPRVPHDRALPAVRASFEALGWSLGATQNLNVADGAFPIALPLVPPRAVALRLAQPRGLAGWHELLEEAGRAGARVRGAEGSVAQRWLGDPAVPAAFGALFGQLALEPAWLREAIDLPETELVALRRASATQQLAALRRAAAAVLRADDPAGAALPARAAALHDALFVEVTPEDAAWSLPEAEAALAEGDALRAHLLASRLRAELRARFGETWWRDPAAGAHLAGLAAQGALEPAAELPPAPSFLLDAL